MNAIYFTLLMLVCTLQASHAQNLNGTQLNLNQTKSKSAGPTLIPDKPGMVQRSIWSSHANGITLPNSLEATASKIKSHFEAKNTSKGLAATFQLDVEAVQPKFQIVSSTGSAADKFYCEQAIWDSAPFLQPFINAHGKISFSSRAVGCSKHSCAETFFRANPNQKNKVVVMHVISPAISDFFPEAVMEEEIHALANLRGVSIAKIKSPLIGKSREGWANFIKDRTNQQVSRQEIVDEGNRILNQNQNIFIK